MASTTRAVNRLRIPMISATGRFAGWRNTSAIGPTCSIFPSRITASRSPIAKASSSRVRHIDHHDIELALQLAQVALQAFARGKVQRGKGFIQQEEPGLGG